MVYSDGTKPKKYSDKESSINRTTSGDITSFCATRVSEVGDNPKDPTKLDDRQREASVELQYTYRSYVDIKLSVEPPITQSRNFNFAGVSDVIAVCISPSTPPSPPPVPPPPPY